MTIHFASAHSISGSPMTRVVRCPAVPLAANDNSPAGTDHAPSEPILRAALRYFAQHGLGAARAARAKAEDAFFAGDREAYDWWLGITRALDRRLAAEAAKGKKQVVTLESHNRPEKDAV